MCGENKKIKKKYAKHKMLIKKEKKLLVCWMCGDNKKKRKKRLY